ncbi:MAG: hypothetical protein IPJ32_04010 [Sphingobacteriaceae bacterium]|nr:hypothetical protein [Sphingobacteriaceae bacterium]
MINEAGFLDTKYITINRVTGFYTDLSQGMILTIPLILLMYLPLIGLEIRKMLKKETSFDFTIFIPLAVLGISITVSTMGNWNHGMAIINRYASWASIVVMMHVFYLSDKLQLTFKTVLFNYFFATQFFTTIYHQRFNKYDWSSGAFTPLAKWTLSKYPELYNPDPFIFAGRTPSDNVLLPKTLLLFIFRRRRLKSNGA